MAVDLKDPRYVYVGWRQGLQNGPEKLKTNIAASSDGSATWGKPMEVTDERGGDFPWMTVTPDTQYGEATAGVDYVYLESSHTFPAGTTQLSFILPFPDVQMIGDDLAEGDESFFLQLYNPTGGAAIARTFGRAVILNDDGAPPMLSVTDAPPQVEPFPGGGTDVVTFQIVLSTFSLQDVTVHYATNYGTATPHVDYQYTEGVFTPYGLERGEPAHSRDDLRRSRKGGHRDLLPPDLPAVGSSNR